MKYTLITGASSGLGKALALQCAAKKMNLLLVALPGGNLEDTAVQIKEQYAIHVKAFECNLSDVDSLHLLAHRLQGYQIDFLINNAGTGGSSDFAKTAIELIDRIILLNIRATALLTRLIIPTLLQQEKSFILNIASISAFTPMPYKSVYPASKAFVSSFSLGLRQEFRGTNLSISSVYPGPILTNSGTARRMIKQGRTARLVLLPCSIIARIAVESTLAGKAVIIPGIWNKLFYWLMKTIPTRLTNKLVCGIIRKELIVSPIN